MPQTILTIRLLLLVFCVMGGLVIWYAYPDGPLGAWLSMLVGLLLGLLLVLIDVLIKGFSLRGLSALTFGLLAGLLASHFITISPLFEEGDPKLIYVTRVCVFIGVTYLSTVIALRGRDEFNLVIPYVRFAPEKIETPVVVLDAAALVDGRITKLCQARLIAEPLFVPKFVLDQLNAQSVSIVEEEKNRGAKGLRTLGDLREMGHVDVRVYDSEVGRGQSEDEKILYVVSSLKGRLLSASHSLITRAKLEGVTYIDLLNVGKAMAYEVAVGEAIRVVIVKLGKEDGQGVGYLEDGSMVVVKQAADLIGRDVLLEVESIIPTSGGRMVFGKLLGEAA